jgi:hypothetical protein
MLKPYGYQANRTQLDEDKKVKSLESPRGTAAACPSHTPSEPSALSGTLMPAQTRT